MLKQKPRARRVADVARAYVVWDIMPQEAMVSIPVPAMRDGRLVAALFGAITLPLPDRSNHWVYAPAIHIAVDWQEEAILGHEVVREVVPLDQDQPVGLLYQPEFAGPATEELSERIWGALTDLYQLLDEVGPLYGRTDLSPPQQQVVDRCQLAFHRWVAPALWPLYDALNPDFFRWVRTNGGGSVTCTSCSSVNPLGSRLCTHCGTVFPCPACGEAALPEGRFCRRCGTPLRA